MNSNVANAMSAKAKAMFGERLKANDYQSLLQKKSVSEIAAYLKNNTYYKATLDGINETQIHRGQLELLVRMDLYNRLSRLMRYYSNKKTQFDLFIIAKIEIEQIIYTIRSLDTMERSALVGKLPLFIQERCSFDLMALSMAHSFDEVLEVLKDTPFRDIVATYKTARMEEIDFVGLEQALTKRYYEIVLNVIENEFSGELKKDLQRVILTRIELDNISKIYRLKKYFNASSEQIHSLITEKYVNFTKKQMDDIIDNIKADDIYDGLKKSYYGAFMDNKDFVYIEYHTKAITFNIQRKTINFSSNPDLIMLSYVLLSQNEIQNIIDIIEGVRYHIAPDKISELLIY